MNTTPRGFLFENKDFWVLFVLNFFSFASHAALNNLPEYFFYRGMSRSFTGFFMNIHVFGLVIFVIFLLPVVEKVGKKNMMIFSYGLACIGYVGMFFSGWDVSLLILWRIMTSLSYAVGFTANAALAFDVLPQEKRTGGIALFGISGILSNPFCAWLGSHVMKAAPQGLFLLGAGFTLLALLLVGMIKEKPWKKESHHAHHLGDVLRRRQVISELIMGMVLGGAFATLGTFIPQQTLERFGSSSLTMYFTVYSIVAIGCRFLFASWLDGISSFWLLLGGFAVASLSLWNMALVFWPLQVALTGMMYGVAHTVLYPTLSALVVKKGREEEKYITNSVFIGFYTLGGLFFSTALGFLGDSVSTASIFVGMGALCLGIIGWMIVKKIVKNK
ncbi:MAG: MFS transporter [Brevinematales bacterium]|nr:MFS transporter [Brevinematales bacterium]